MLLWRAAKLLRAEEKTMDRPEGQAKNRRKQGRFRLIPTDIFKITLDIHSSLEPHSTSRQ